MPDTPSKERPVNKKEMVADLLVKRADRVQEATRLVDRAKTTHRNFTDAEETRFNALESDIRALDERLSELREQIDADEATYPMATKYAKPTGGTTMSTSTVTSHRSTVSPNSNYRPKMPGYAYLRSAWTITSEPEVYREHNPNVSYFRDLHNAMHSSERDAIDRLQRNDRMVHERARQAGEVRAISTTNGQGGEFTPPLWLESAFVELARPGRVTADLTEIEPLPGGTDQINIPKVVSGTATAVQTTQNSAIQQTDMATTSISSPIVTLAGGQTLSLQLLEQSPVPIDKILLADLAADYAMKLDGQVLAGTGAAGQLMGLLTMGGTQAITWTQTTPALSGAGGFYSVLASAIAATHTSRFASADTIVMHPRRWMWLAAQADLSNRPLIVPGAAGPLNAMGIAGDINAEGPAGTILGLPVYLDPNIPINLGAGANEDRVIITRRTDLTLWEGRLKAETFPQTYAQNLSVFVRLYNYAAFIPNRYPQATAIISGTGLKTPAF